MQRDESSCVLRDLVNRKDRSLVRGTDEANRRVGFGMSREDISDSVGLFVTVVG